MNKFYILLLLQAITVGAFAQNFAFHSAFPFGTELVTSQFGGTSSFLFYDFDHDGDLDFIQSGIDSLDDVENPGWENLRSFFRLQENLGDKWNPVFGDPRNYSTDFPFPVGYFSAALGDLNVDGATDLIVSADIDFIGNQSLLYYRGNGNNFDITNMADMELAPFVPESFYSPALVDLDADGDLDLLMSGFDSAFGEEDGADIPQIFYAKNTTVRSVEPQFTGWYLNPYGLEPNPYAEILSSGDIDNDGDEDLIGSTMFFPVDSLVYIYLHPNNPANSKPSFDTVLLSPFGLPSHNDGSQFLSPRLVDLDADGDLDLFVINATSAAFELHYYENDLCIVVTTTLDIDLCEGDSYSIGENNFTEEGNYTVHLESENGCDSIVDLTIEIIPISTTSQESTICEGESIIVGNETFSEPGNYLVFVSASNGCDSIIELSLTVNEIYGIPIEETICKGETFNVGDQTFTESGQYEVELLSNAGCDSIINLVLEVIEINSNVIVSGNTITANLSGATYQWFDCDSGLNIPGATNQSFTPGVSGNYAVYISGASGCSDTSACNSITITKTNDLYGDTGIIIYPNPTSGIFSIETKDNYNISTIELLNLLGKPLQTFKYGNQLTIDQSFSKGIYLVKIEMEGHIIVKKLILN